MLTIPTERDEKLIVQLHPVLQPKFRYLIVVAHEQGMVVGFHSGVRTFDAQDSLFLKGRNAKGEIVDQSQVVTNARGGDSIHNYGLAGDVVFLVNGQWSWNYSGLPYARLGVIAKEVGLIWGGDWKFQDPPHFQYTGGLSLREIKDLYAAGGMPAVWRKVT